MSLTTRQKYKQLLLDFTKEHANNDIVPQDIDVDQDIGATDLEETENVNATDC